MYKPKFRDRLIDLGIDGLIKSVDFLTFIAVFLGGLYVFDGAYSATQADQLLEIFITVSSSLFAIILTGLAITLSFSDPAFIYAWNEGIDDFDEMVTVFQFNLYLPVMILSLSLILRFVKYDGTVMVFLMGFFAYMLVSLLDIVNFLAKYGLQRAEFISQQIEKSVEQGNREEEDTVSEEELEQILIKLRRHEERVKDK